MLCKKIIGCHVPTNLLGDQAELSKKEHIGDCFNLKFVCKLVLFHLFLLFKIIVSFAALTSGIVTKE